MTGIVVPVNPSRTLSDTIAYAAREAAATDGELHLVRTAPGYYVTGAAPAEVLAHLEESAAIAENEVEDLVVHTAPLGVDVYVSGPDEHAELLIEYAEANGADRVIVDPSYSPDATAPELYSIERVFRGLPIAYEHALVDSPGRIPSRGELIRGGLIGAVAFLFYIALGGPTYPFALATGLVTGLIAAVVLRNVTFESTPDIGSGVRIAARGVVFVPFLLWEIAKANVLFAYVVLHPSLPIEPHLDEVEMAVGSGLSVTAVANAITLTPGTLTVDADGHHLLVHSLNGTAREDLLDGLHEGAVRNLFYGSAEGDLPGPGERGDYHPIAGPAAVTDGGESLDDGATNERESPVSGADSEVSQ